MLKLRRAVETDFETFKILYEDDNDEMAYQWLYYDYNSNEEKKEPTEDERKMIEGIMNDLSEILDSFKNYTIERFKKALESNYIYMIQTESEVVGYISMFFCGNGVYKIAEWALFNPKDDDIKIKVLEELVKLKLPRLREFSICVCNKSVVNFLLENGFKPSRASAFYKLEVKR